MLILMAAVVPALCRARERASNSLVTFDRFGFKLEIPRPFEKHALPLKPGEKLSEIYLSGGLAYVVKVTDLPPDSLASTVVEQTLQAEMKQASQAKRWERNSDTGELFKGIACLTKVDLNSAPWLEKITGGKHGLSERIYGPAGGRVIAYSYHRHHRARERSVEIDNLAEYLVSTV